jgi:hypothetical protein
MTDGGDGDRIDRGRCGRREVIDATGTWSGWRDARTRP